MSGLAVCWSRGNGASVDPGVLDRIEAALPRGEGEGVVRWSAGPVGIVQASRDGAGPATAADGAVLALDGRIDATRDLGLRPADEGTTLARRNQAALVAARSRWGDRFLEQLIGDYALVVWHPRSHTLTAARDPVGIRPVYYGLAGSDVVVATELACVLAHPRLRRVANEGMVAEILADDVVSRDETLYRDVHRVLAGHALEVREDRISLRCFRRIEVGASLRYRRQEDYEEHYRSVLGHAVADRLRGPGGVAMELSGGIDSSSVTAVAAGWLRSEGRATPRTYSLVYPGRVEDELPYIEAMVAFHDLRSSVIEPAAPEPGRLAEQVARWGGLPDQPNLVGWEELLRTAWSDGVESVLGGQGGDQRFETSFWHPAELLRRGRLRASFSAARELAPGRSPAGAAMTHSLRPLAGSIARRLGLRRRGSYPPWIGARFAEEVDLTDRLQVRPIARSPAAGRVATTRGGFETLALEIIARCADRCGIGYRHPFYDLRMIDFAVALPEAQRWFGGEMRAIQRRSLAHVLPPMVRGRTTKADFSRLFPEEFARQGGRARFAHLAIADIGWVEPKVILGLYDEMEDGLARTGTPDHIWPLWQVLAVDEWARMAFPGA